MAGLSNLLYTARDALAAQSYGLNVTGSNVANANTPGYVRRDTLLETTVLGTQTSGSVDVAGLRRTTDQFLDQRANAANGQASYANERDSQLASVENLVDDSSGGGLGDALSQLYSSFTALAANPNDPTTRETVLDRAASFASQANDIGSAIGQQKSDILSEAQGVATDINQHATDLANLNQQIAAAENAGQDAADLKDRRDQKLSELSALVDTHSFMNSSGNLVVQAAGMTLVEGQVARQLSVGLASDGTMQINSNRPGGLTEDVTSFVTGGKLGALRDTRDVDLKQVGDKFDQFVYDVATAVNTQHAAGTGLDGVSGRNLFSISATSAGAARAIAIDPSVAGQPNSIAAASSVGSLPGGSDNAVLLGQLSSQTFASGGTRTGGDAYADIVGDVASRKAQSADSVTLRADVKAQADTQRESVSGVSLDEEMISLTKYQNAYQAAQKVLKTADDLMQGLLDMVPG